MRKYAKEPSGQLKLVVCNCCGKTLSLHKGVIAEDFLAVDKQWGFFSNKDGRIDSFDLCEECYDRIIKEFSIAPSQSEVKEWMQQ